jgi:hypothetical protein
MLPSKHNTVALRIKSPNARYPDLMLTSDRHLSVLGLKGLIEASFPAHPPPADQKLVYAGKLLGDELLLEQFLRFEDDCSVFTIHLVCRIPEQPSKAAVPPASSLNHEANDGLRYRGANPADSSAMTTTNIASAEMAPATESESSTLAADPLDAEARELRRIQELLQSLATSATEGVGAEELANMETYYRQYLQLYSQHMLRQASPPHHQADHQLMAQPDRVGPGALANDEADNNNNNNDLLDRIYAITRIMLLFSVIYFHSSFFRLLCVAIIAFIVNRFQNNRINNNNNNRVPDNEVLNRRGEQQNIAAANVQPNNAGRDGNSAADTVEPEVAGEEEEEEKPNLLVVAVNFVSSFLSSIIPGNNPPI